MSLRMTGSSDEWIKVSKAGGRDGRVSTASGERRSMSREDEGGRKYSRDLCDNRDLRDESDESLAETEVYVSDENRWRKASEVFPDHPGDANGRRSRALSERRESGDIRQSLSRKSGFGDGDRQSVSYRKSYASRDDEGDARRSVASRKSYTDDGGDRLERRSTRKSTFEDAGDAHRASRKSYADVEDGDLRRSVMRKSEVDLGRDEEGGDVRRATRKSDVREEEGDNLRRSERMSYASEGPIARQSVANRKSYASIQDSDLRRSVAARASYDLGRDDEGDARRSVVTRKSNREEEIDLNRRSLSRKSYAEEDAEAARLSAAPRMSRSEGEEGPRASRAERRSRLEGAEQRMLSQPPEDFESEILMQDGFRRKSEAYVSDENRWRKASEVFPDHPGDANGRRSRAVSERRESGDIRQSLSRKSGFGDGDVNRPSVANRKSYADQGDRQSVSYRKSYASRDDEGDARRSVASRKSYTDDGGDRFEHRSTRKSTFEDAGDARRASRKSYADVEDGDLRRSVIRKSEVDLGRDEEGGDFRRATRKSDVREEEGDLRRSVASRASYDVGRDDDGDARRSVVTRKSTREEEIDLNRRSLSRKSYAEEGPRASRAERRSHLEGAEQRKLSQPPEDSESDILMQDGFRRKSEVRGPKARQMLTLELDADSPSEMKSIVWKFTERGACVKVLNKDCPEASPEMLRAGDLLALINDECVLDQPKAFIQKTWKEQQLEDRFVTLRTSHC